jgi:hypothetical protein
MRDGEPLNWGKSSYSELVGSLLYLRVCTRPTIAQDMGVLARYMSAPTEVHWRVALGVVRYLAVTATCGLTYESGGTELKAYCNEDYAGDTYLRRSTTGYVSVMHAEP